MAVLTKNEDGTFTIHGNGLDGGQVERGSLAGSGWGGRFTKKANSLLDGLLGATNTAQQIVNKTKDVVDATTEVWNSAKTIGTKTGSNSMTPSKAEQQNVIPPADVKVQTSFSFLDNILIFLFNLQ